MKSEPVSLPVIAGVSLDCSFWPEDDGWSGVCENLMVIVRGSSFEDAKKHMETALQEHIEGILREQLGRGAQRVGHRNRDRGAAVGAPRRGGVMSAPPRR